MTTCRRRTWAIIIHTGISRNAHSLIERNFHANYYTMRTRLHIYAYISDEFEFTFCESEVKYISQAWEIFHDQCVCISEIWSNHKENA